MVKFSLCILNRNLRMFTQMGLRFGISMENTFLFLCTSVFNFVQISQAASDHLI